MQPIHNPCNDLRQSLQSDIDAYLKRGGKIKSEPVKLTPTKPSKFVMISGKKEPDNGMALARKNEDYEFIASANPAAQRLYENNNASYNRDADELFGKRLSVYQNQSTDFESGSGE